MRITLGAVLLILVAAQTAAAQNAPAAQPPADAPVFTSKPADPTGAPMLLATAGQFIASDSTFKDVYGNGPVFGGELRIPIGPGGRRLAVFVDGSYRTRTGSLTYTGESTKASVVAGEGGLLFRLRQGTLAPYLGVGGGYYSLSEESGALGSASKGGAGFVAVGGFTWAVSTHFVIDGRVKYSSAKLQPAAQSPDVTFKVDVGGITAGGGIGIAF